MAATLSLEPAGRSCWDEPLSITVRGLAPEQPVTLRAALRDEKDALFRAHARYRADAHGELDLARSPALGGSFTGLEPMGLIWAMEPERPLWRLIKRDVQTPFVVQLEVLDGHEPDGGRLLARAVHERHFMAPGVRRVPVREGRCELRSFCPQVKGPGIGLLGISKGAELCLSMASFLKGITAAVIINGSVAIVARTLKYKDESLPSLGFDKNRIKVTKCGFSDGVDFLNFPLEGAEQKCIIPVERSDTTFLFLVGLDGHNWKSEFYAREASKLLQAHGKEKPQIICYPETEPPYFPWCKASLHTSFNNVATWGGEPRSHAMAQVDAWQQLQTFFP